MRYEGFAGSKHVKSSLLAQGTFLAIGKHPSEGGLTGKATLSQDSAMSCPLNSKAFHLAFSTIPLLQALNVDDSDALPVTKP